MKNFIELEKGLKNNEDIRALGMEIAQFIFARSQENLVQPMPWGDKSYASNRKPSRISDQSQLLQSGVPPYWEDDLTIVFRYDAPHAPYVEYGTPPHPVGANRLLGWVNRKLNIKGKRAERVAWAIATKIKQEGMDPHPFIRPAVEDARRQFKMVQIRAE